MVRCKLCILIFGKDFLSCVYAGFKGLLISSLWSSQGYLNGQNWIGGKILRIARYLSSLSLTRVNKERCWQEGPWTNFLSDISQQETARVKQLQKHVALYSILIQNTNQSLMYANIAFFVTVSPKWRGRVEERGCVSTFGNYQIWTQVLSH